MDSNSEFTENIANVLECLEKEFELSTEDFSWSAFQEGDSGCRLSEDYMISLGLPRCEYDISIKCSQLPDLLAECRSAKLIDNAECITNRRYLAIVQPVFAETQADFYNAMEHIESQDGGAFIITHREGQNTHVCKLVEGFTPFGVMVAASGNYDKYFPPVSSDDIFVEITSTDEGITLEKYRDLFRAYSFELSSSLSFDIAISSRPNIDYYEEDSPKKEYSEKFRPLLSGKGISEPLDLYVKAIESPSPDIAILYFTKILEFVSQTVIRIQLTGRIRTKLLTQRALDPDAEFIRELGQLFDDNKVYKKDRDALKITIATCCEAMELQKVVPKCVLSKWDGHLSNGNAKMALEDLAFCIASTRNGIAHAKSNYESTGREAPEEEYEQLAKCMKICAQQVIRWYASRHESQRLW